MSNSNYLLSFLEALNEKAAETAEKMEEIIFSDPQGAMFRARLFAEEIIKDVFVIEEYDEYQFPSAFERINHLSKEGVLTRDIQQALDTIRISGNKAVHNADFDDIFDALKVYKMMHKLATWYTEVYSTENIAIPEYRNPKPPKAELSKEDITSFIHEALKEHGNVQKEVEVHSEVTQEKPESEEEQDNIIDLSLPVGKSYLLREMRRLQDSAQEAVENANSFSRFKDYMHVERKIQKDFESILEKAQSEHGPQLILLCGSVGDGKSHLLAYLNENKPQLLEGFQVLNDATESFSPNMNAIETLSELLDGFSDEKISDSNDHIILAINLGVLHNFITQEHEGKTFNGLKQFIDNSHLFSPNVTTKYSEQSFHLVGFSDYHAYELTKEGPTSTFFATIVERVFSEDENNPFYIAYQEDLKLNHKLIIHENYEFLLNKDVQQTIIQLIIQAIVKYKLVISARAFYNFIADLILPDQYEEKLDGEWTQFEKLNHTVPNLLFRRRERSFILRTMVELDPIHIRTEAVDKVIIDVNTFSDWQELITNYIKDISTVQEWLNPITNQEEVSSYSANVFTQALIRLTYLSNREFAINATPIAYKKYMNHLYFFNKKEITMIRTLYDEVKTSIFKWKGSPKKSYIYLNKANEKFRVAQFIDLRPSIDHLTTNHDDVLTSFKQTLTIAYHGGEIKEKQLVEIDYPLYELLLNVQNGYCPNKKDEEDAIKFVEFIEKIMRFGKRNEELLIHIPSEQKIYKLGLDDFGGFVYEKE
ncbi:DNA phosphorothioation-dependent restriction protein DptF [Alkalihalobacillus deserti]|uniref:DNA phosphorothioation-dependent restriction protein DptF n=1 Tax=Alkalihalobacillus deserti TaxID=2879466 RepID=UPI001D15B3FF|nr:DNA phosphorothioation-dependent restriction protein DptF [Alkalihalobacillus deserti]